MKKNEMEKKRVKKVKRVKKEKKNVNDQINKKKREREKETRLNAWFACIQKTMHKCPTKGLSSLCPSTLRSPPTLLLPFTHQMGRYFDCIERSKTDIWDVAMGS